MYNTITEGIVQRLPFNITADLKQCVWVSYSQYVKVHFTDVQINGGQGTVFVHCSLVVISHSWATLRDWFNSCMKSNYFAVSHLSLTQNFVIHILTRNVLKKTRPTWYKHLQATSCIFNVNIIFFKKRARKNLKGRTVYSVDLEV